MQYDTIYSHVATCSTFHAESLCRLDDVYWMRQGPGRKIVCDRFQKLQNVNQPDLSITQLPHIASLLHTCTHCPIPFSGHMPLPSSTSGCIYSIGPSARHHRLFGSISSFREDASGRVILLRWGFNFSWVSAESTDVRTPDSDQAEWSAQHWALLRGWGLQLRMECEREKVGGSTRTQDNWLQ